MESRWFQKGFRPVRFYVEDDQVHSLGDTESKELGLEPTEPPPPPPLPPPPPQQEDDDSGWESDSSVASCPATLSSEERQERQRPAGRLTRPASLNAFDIISFSKGFDLSGLFEERGSEMRFISAEPMQTIITKLEEIAKVKSFSIRRKDWRVSIEGTREGEKGPLTIGAEIFELTPSLLVVEVKKKAGDKEEYDDFCNKELKPGMEPLVHHQTGSAPNVLSYTH
jgi:5'-AMP-activated protein kinase catalytic alpha subunit